MQTALYPCQDRSCQDEEQQMLQIRTGNMDGSCEITRIPTPVKEETNFAVSNDKRQQNSGKR
jgi:hypothetical protein